MTVSILLPFYNRAHTLARCVESVLAQTLPSWELLAVDDGSSDGSAELLRSYRDPRLRLLRHEGNRGPSAARNTALAAATGPWLALLDSDDEWLPTKLEEQLAFLHRHGLEACGCEYFLLEGGRETHVTLPEPPSWPEQLHRECRLGNGTTLLVRREAFQAVGPFAEELRLYEDWDWLLRFTRRFRYGVVPAPLARVHVSGPRSPRAFARSARLFLARHEAEFRRLGWRHAREIRSLHWENVATNAFRQREFPLGLAATLTSLSAAPWRKPWQAAALPLGLLDWLCHTSLLARTARWPSSP